MLQSFLGAFGEALGGIAARFLACGLIVGVILLIFVIGIICTFN